MSEQQLSVVEVEFKEGKELAEWFAVSADLVFARECAKKLIDLGADADDSILMRSLWTSALVAYCRCFATGKRARLFADKLGNHPREPRVLHDHIVKQRDKLIAHSVNPFEQMKSGVLLKPAASKERGVLAALCVTSQLVGWKDDHLKQFHDLVSLVHREIVTPMVNDLKERVLRRAQALAINDLYKLPVLVMVTPGSDEAGLPRID